MPGYVLETGSEKTTQRDVALIFAAAFTASTMAPLKMQPLAMLGRMIVLEATYQQSLDSNCFQISEILVNRWEAIGTFC